MIKIDAHVHIVGNGSGGTGCWMRPPGWRWPLVHLMLKGLGLPRDSLNGDLDSLYVERLRQLTQESSLDAIVILAHDRAYGGDGRVLEDTGTFYVPNDYVLDLSARYPEFLPGVSIHPGRPDALEELERCLQGGAFLMKCLPNCHNIDCNDRRYAPFWERMAEAGLPLLAHTGGEHTLPVVKAEFANPKTLELPLQCGVTVIAAHCGTKSGLLDPDYFEIFAKMTERYPRLFGDTSAFTVPIRSRHVPDCLRIPLVERLVHGSDLPVPILGHWAWCSGLVKWKSFRQWERHPNSLERDYQLKRAMGFPEEVFTRMSVLGRRAVAWGSHRGIGSVLACQSVG